jgi:hypothetical protein
MKVASQVAVANFIDRLPSIGLRVIVYSTRRSLDPRGRSGVVLRDSKGKNI